jgi:hypothetical protein
MNNNIKFTLVALALTIAGHAQADTTTASAQQQATSQAVAQGSIQFSQSPADTSATIRNVSAPILGSYAPAMAPFSCAPTTQAGVAFAGFSIGGGGAVDKKSCVLLSAASETVRQAVNTAGISTVERDKMLTAANNMRCQVSAEVYHALIDAGIPCSRAPDDLPRAETQPVSTRVSP